MSKGPPPPDQDHLSAAEWVRQQLINDILNGERKPGSRLKEIAIAQELGCSRTPVREALCHLEALGLATFRKNQGAMVAQLDQARMVELFEALAETASSCAGLAAACPVTQRKALTSVEWSLAPGPGSDGRGKDLFEAVFDGCGNRFLGEQGNLLHQRLMPYWLLLGRVAGGWPGEGRSARAALLAAIAEGRASPARRAMRGLVLRARDLALRGVSFAPGRASGLSARP